MTPVSFSNPSISTKIIFRVCSLSSCPPPIPAPRCLPMASNSSIKIIEGAAFFAVANKSRTRAEPTPTNISTNSEPEIEKNGTLASPATARAKSVFPTPAAPSKSTPLGILAPIAKYFLGNFKKSTISVNSSLASFNPAASLKVIFSLLFGSAPKILARDLVKSNTWPAPTLVRFNIVQRKNPISKSGKIPYSNAGKSHDQTLCCSTVALISIFCSLVLSAPKFTNTSGKIELVSFIELAVLSSV